MEEFAFFHIQLCCFKELFLFSAFSCCNQNLILWCLKISCTAARHKSGETFYDIKSCLQQILVFTLLYGQAALERQGLSCMYPAHHELVIFITIIILLLLLSVLLLSLLWAGSSSGLQDIDHVTFLLYISVRALSNSWCTSNHNMVWGLC